MYYLKKNNSVKNKAPNKGQEALDSIPDEYEEVYSLAREGAEKADAIVCTTSGETITVVDSSDDFMDCKFEDKFVLALGSEATGISKEISDLSDFKIIWCGTICDI